MWSNILSKFESADYVNSLATELAFTARVNLVSSTNFDSSAMTTKKTLGRPLIDTGAMLRSISANANQVTVNTDYAADVQLSTGNTFIDKPTPDMIATWSANYIAKSNALPGSVTNIQLG